MIWCWWMKPTCCCRPRKRAWAYILNIEHRQGIDVMYRFVMSTGFFVSDSQESYCRHVYHVGDGLISTFVFFSRGGLRLRNLNRLLRTLQQQTGLKLRSFHGIGSARGISRLLAAMGFAGLFDFNSISRNQTNQTHFHESLLGSKLSLCSHAA